MKKKGIILFIFAVICFLIYSDNVYAIPYNSVQVRYKQGTDEFSVWLNGLSGHYGLVNLSSNNLHNYIELKVFLYNPAVVQANFTISVCASSSYTGRIYNGYDTSIQYSKTSQTCSLPNGSGNIYKAIIPDSYSSNESVTAGNGISVNGVNYMFGITAMKDNNTTLSWKVDSIKIDAYDSNGKVIDNLDKNQQETNERLDEANKNLGEINDSLTDPTVDQRQANGFFNDFSSDDFGLSDIITMPLTFINGLSSNVCYDLEFPLPFVNQNAKLPCMTSIYQEHFGPILTIYQTITTGFIAYWVCVNIFRLVQNFKNPENDQVEVLDL